MNKQTIKKWLELENAEENLLLFPNGGAKQSNQKSISQ